MQQYHLKAISLDYVSPANRSLACKTVKKIEALGFIPWVTNGEIDVMGISNVKIESHNGFVTYENKDQSIWSKFEELITRPCS